MAHSQMNRVLQTLRRAALRDESNSLSDRELLELFLLSRDESAFEALVRRHGPMVLGVCRRVLVNQHDAEDAFQATFLVLVRKASSIVKRDTVGNWLYGVAYRTAQKARLTTARRRVKEMQMAKPEALEEDDIWRELRPLLDQELNGLPAKYREPVVLCDLEGNSRKDAAQRLGCPEGTLSGRLSRARMLLAKRLARRGLILSGGVLAMALSRSAATACLPAPLVSSTVQTATLLAAGYAVAGAASAPVAALTEGVLKAMFVTKLKVVTAIALSLGLLGAGFSLYLTHASAQTPQIGRATSTPAPAPAKDEEKKADGKDEEKINLPTGAAPQQVLVSLDKDGKLVVKSAMMVIRGFGGGGGGGGGGGIGLPGGPGGGGGGIRIGGPGGAPVPGPGGQVQMAAKLLTQTFDLDDVQVLDTKGKKVDKKDLPKMLKEETVAMASLYGQEVDPLHLRVLKEGTLTFVLPAPKFAPGGGFGGGGVGGPVQPLPAPAPGGRPGGGGFGVPTPAPVPPMEPVPPGNPENN